VQSTVSGMKTDFDDVQKSLEGTTATEPQTDWDRIYATRRQREKIKDRRIEREKELGIKRPKRPFHR
jgi:hypothetical protein